MSSKQILFAILVALGLVGIYQLVNLSSKDYPVYKYKTGQIADIPIIAPFDFPIYKSEEQINQETDQLIEKLAKPFQRSTDVEFLAKSNLDNLFGILFGVQSRSVKNKDLEELQNKGFVLTNIDQVYNISARELQDYYQDARAIQEDLFKTGIYSNYESDSLYIVEGETKTKYKTSDYLKLDQAMQKFLQRFTAPPQFTRLIEDNKDKLIRPNLLLDEAAYAEMVKTARSGISHEIGKVLQNEEIVRINKRLTEADIRKLESLNREYQLRGASLNLFQHLLTSLSMFLLMYMILMVFHGFLLEYRRADFQSGLGLFLLDLVLLVLAGLAALFTSIPHFGSGFIPLTMAVISISILLGFDIGILFCVSATMILSPFLGWAADRLVVLLLTSLITLLLIRKFKSKRNYLRIWFYLFSVGIALELILVFLTTHGERLESNIREWILNTGYATIWTTVSIIGIMAVVSFWDKKWRRATKQALLELLDFNHPLLKKLAATAPGTYHHSLVVGNLAEQAAGVVGANPLLARVGSYYHDIGKILNPEIFTENNENSQDLHNALTTEESADLIRNHVNEGVVLADKYRLPKPVIDIIEQHHGTSYIRYFLEIAQRKESNLDLSLYKYPGPLPQSKEAALVMLADILESTIKSRSDADEEDILRIYEETIQRIYRDGQFDEAPITFRELAEAKVIMVQILGSVYRKRQEYPEDSL